MNDAIYTQQRNLNNPSNNKNNHIKKDQISEVDSDKTIKNILQHDTTDKISEFEEKTNNDDNDNYNDENDDYDIDNENDDDTTDYETFIQNDNDESSNNNINQADSYTVKNTYKIKPSNNITNNHYNTEKSSYNEPTPSIIQYNLNNPPLTNALDAHADTIPKVKLEDEDRNYRFNDNLKNLIENIKIKVNTMDSKVEKVVNEYKKLLSSYQSNEIHHPKSNIPYISDLQSLNISKFSEREIELLYEKIYYNITATLMPKLFEILNQAISPQIFNVNDILLKFKEWWNVKKQDLLLFESNINNMLLNMTGIMNTLLLTTTTSTTTTTTTTTAIPQLLKETILNYNNNDRTLSKFCDKKYEYNIVWNITLAGDTVTIECPDNILGNTTRKCNNDGTWSTPNFINCSSNIINNVNMEIRKSNLTIISTNYMLELTKQLTNTLEIISQQRMLYSGEIKLIISILNDMVQYLDKNSNNFDIEFLNFLLAVIDYLLDPINCNEWLTFYNVTSYSEVDIIQLIRKIVTISQNSNYKINSCVSHHFRFVDYSFYCNMNELANQTHGNFVANTQDDENSMFIELRNLMLKTIMSNSSYPFFSSELKIILNNQPNTTTKTNSVQSISVFGKFTHNPSNSIIYDSNQFILQLIANDDKAVIYELFDVYCVEYSWNNLKYNIDNNNNNISQHLCSYDPVILTLTCKCLVNTFNTLYFTDSKSSNSIKISKMQDLTINSSNTLINHISIFIGATILIILLVATVVIIFTYKPHKDVN